MPEWLEISLLVLFLVLLITPGLYGLHMYVLLVLAHRRMKGIRQQQREIIARYSAGRADADWPRVTTQLPLYNELAVARRAIEAAAAMDYPPGRHQIQVLDDSTDDTRSVVDQVAVELRARGLDVVVIRRADRREYKAGALANGLRSATGEYVAIFDADFVPDRGFLRRLIPLIDSQPQAGCVQGRWGHLNGDESWITEAMALGMDGHFGVEQGARAWNGLLMNFNGTAGIWRRSAIEDPRVGGWQGDTLTEDLDLSYRAQLAGWKVLYCIDEVVPGEVPADVNALKTQQRRWALGSTQTARKLLPLVWRSSLTLAQKLEATVHLTNYSVAVFMILMALLGRTLLLPVDPARAQVWLAWSWWIVVAAMLAPSIAYVYARWAIGGGVAGPLRILKLMVLGMGLSINNGAAVLTGLFANGGEFVRTPKSGAAGARQTAGPYAAIRSRLWMLEIALGLVCLAQWLIFLRRDHYLGGTFLLLYAIGSLYLGWRSRPIRPRPVPSRAAPPELAGAAPTA